MRMAAIVGQMLKLNTIAPRTELVHRSSPLVARVNIRTMAHDPSKIQTAKTKTIANASSLSYRISGNARSGRLDQRFSSHQVRLAVSTGRRVPRSAADIVLHPAFAP